MRNLFETSRSHLLLLMVLAAAFWLYYPTLHAPLHGDDYFAFIDISTKPFPRFMRDVLLFKDSNVGWRPLAQVYYYAMYQVFGLSGGAYHAFNLCVFMATLAALYGFCLTWGLGRLTAAAAAGMFALFPSHVVTVAWVTTAEHMLAICFFLLGMIALLRGLRRHSLRLEALAQGLFLLGYLSDETSVVLSPIIVLAALAFDDRPNRWRRGAWRSVPTMTPALAVVFAQMTLGVENGNTQPHLGPTVLEHLWGLAGRLVYVSETVQLRDAPAGQWVAGAVVLALLGAAITLGSTRLKLLALWTLAALAPFALTLPISPPRYVYGAAVPFSICSAWIAGAAVSGLASALSRQRLALGVKAAAAPALAVLMVATLFRLGPMTRAKNAEFDAAAQRYAVLAAGLRQAMPTVEPGTTIVIYYGTWGEPFDFASAVAKTVYRDRSIEVVNVPRGLVAEGRRVYPKERRLYNTSHGLILAAPRDVLQAH